MKIWINMISDFQVVLRKLKQTIKIKKIRFPDRFRFSMNIKDEPLMSRLGDVYMKPNKPNFWIVIAILYLVVLCAIIMIYNPDFLDIKNCLLFLPLYAPIVVAIILTNKGEDDSNKPWTIKWALLAATLIVVVFKIIVDKI